MKSNVTEPVGYSLLSNSFRLCVLVLVCSGRHFSLKRFQKDNQNCGSFLLCHISMTTECTITLHRVFLLARSGQKWKPASDWLVCLLWPFSTPSWFPWVSFCALNVIQLQVTVDGFARSPVLWLAAHGKMASNLVLCDWLFLQGGRLVFECTNQMANSPVLQLAVCCKMASRSCDAIGCRWPTVLVFSKSCLQDGGQTNMAA